MTRQRLYILVFGILFHGSAYGAGRLSLGIEQGFFSLTGSDNVTLARAVVSTNYDFGLNLAWYQQFKGFGEGYIKVRTKTFGTGAPSGADVLVSNQTHTSVYLGVLRPLGRSLLLNAYLDYSQYLLMTIPSVSTILLSAAQWPGAGIDFELLLFSIGIFRTSIEAGGGIAIPTDSLGYSPLFNVDGSTRFGFYGRKVQVVFGPFFRFQMTGTSHMTQFLAELGGTLNFTLVLGKGSKYQFLFSPRK